MSVQVELLTGNALRQAIPALAALRIEVFREWPYLYDGSLDYENWYLSKFTESPGALMLVARDGDEVVGASTGAPLSSQLDDWVTPFRDHGDDPETIFYFGESCLKPDYRGLGIGVRFFIMREAQAAQLGYRLAAFTAVVRPESHRLKPPGYVALDPFWRNRGYAPVPGFVVPFRWKDIDQSAESQHMMQVWTKALR